MKIGFDVSQTCEERAGCAWYADSLARALVRIAPGHQFFLYHQFGDWINQSTETGTRIDAPNATPTFTDVTPTEAQRIWRSPAELLIKTGAPDIVHANSFRAPRVPGAKVVFTVYDLSFWTVPHFTTEKNRLVCQAGMLQALGHADGFIFISQSTHDEFERMLPGWLEQSGKPSLVTLLAPRIAMPASPPPALPPTHWLAVGSLEPRKNYTTLLDAMERYWRQSTRRLPLKIAGGPGWKSARLKQRIDDLGRQGLVQYLGYVPDEELPPLYAGAEALIFPSWYEGFGLPVLEALAGDCPVLCSNTTSLPEVGGTAATYFNPGNPDAIMQAMLACETDPGARPAVQAAGRQQAARFSWEKTAGLTLDFYQQVLAAPPAVFPLR